jgi:FkbM family methyltransferase
LTERILALQLWGERPFWLLDVGCSGGIAPRFRMLGERLEAVGFDPLVAEIDRLTRANVHPGVRYEAAFVIYPEYDRLFPPELRSDRVRSRDNSSFARVSAAAAMRRMPTSYVQQVFNAGAPVVMSDRSVALDDYLSASEHDRVDFIKIDTDGHDIEVILGAQAMLTAGGALGLTVEVQFHGPTHDYANTFANIDRILRGHGFTLFDLDTYRYSRAELPAPFVLNLAAQTTSGQVQWGEALYFRDLAAPDYERMWPYEITRERVMKLACLFDLFDLPDCAAELIINRGGFLDPGLRESLLDLLASGERGAYAALVADFEEDFTRFYPSRMEAAPEGVEPAPVSVPQTDDSRLTRELQEKVSTLTQKNVALRKKLTIQKDRLAQMAKRIEELKTKRGARTGETAP